MPQQQKKDLVDKLKELSGEASAIYISDYQGIEANILTDIRRRIRGCNAKFLVCKNRLFNKSQEDKEYFESIKENKGPSAYVYCFEDTIEPLKELVKIAKENKTFTIKCGILEGKYFDRPQLAEIAKLESRTALLSKLAYLMQYPLAGFAGVLKQIITKPAYALNNLIEKKKNQEV